MPEPDEDFLRQLREAFSVEATEHLHAISDGLLELEKSPDPSRQPQILEVIFREAHSLKGAARAVNRTGIESICQAMEGAFSDARKMPALFSPQAFDVLNGALDLVSQRLMPAGTAPDPSEIAAMVQRIAELRSAAKHSPAASPSEPPAPAPSEAVTTAARSAGPTTAPGILDRFSISQTVRIPMAKMDSLLLQAEEMLSVKLTARQHAVDLKELTLWTQQWRKEWARAFGQRGLGQAGGKSQGDEATLAQFLEWNHGYLRALESKMTALARGAETDHRAVGAMVDSLLEDAKRLVMLPFATLLELFPKMARDLARAQEKEVETVISGRDVEIDKRILEELKDPLVHLVRNVIDHGIEPPETRTSQRKPARGLMTIAVSQVNGNHVEILVRDDGSGIDVGRVKASAIQHGVLSADEAAQRTDAEILPFIFQSGISTSPIVTDLSGRGLGMAIVREKVERLGGHVAVESRLGVGTTFRIRLPVTLSTYQGLLVETAGQRFVIPTANIERVVRLPRTEVHPVENRATITHRGQAVSLVRLDSVLEMTPRDQRDEKMLMAVVLAAGETRVAFEVDEVLDEEEVLVKSLGKLLQRVRNVAAATVLGSGSVVPILNVADLLKSAVQTTASSSFASGARRPEKAVRQQSLLVVDDSVTSRMLLKNILESAGYAVKTAVDGLEAWTTLKMQDFDLVVSDIEMPRMNGFDLTTRIRGDKKLAHLPVVLVTALESREHRERGVDAGANAYIVKSSFDQSNLLEVVRRCL